MPHAEHMGVLARILLIDAYDSFSNSIVALVESLLHAEVTVIHIDDQRYLKHNGQSFRELLQGFDAVIAGPGPGSPDLDADVGLIKVLWTLEDEHLLPILGICLGFQSLALAFGARVERLVEPRHGIVARLRHNGDSLFANTDEALITQYNSLTVRLHSDSFPPSSDTDDSALWCLSDACPALAPLAWTCDDLDNGPVLQAVKHRSKPFWAVQYHPESVCTNEGGARIILNWWTEVLKWQRRCDKLRAFRVKLNHEPPRCRISCLDGENPMVSAPSLTPLPSLNSKFVGRSGKTTSSSCVDWGSIPLETMTAKSIAERLKITSGNVVIIESATREDGMPVNAETGRFSILGCFNPGDTERIEYFSSTKQISTTVGLCNAVRKPCHDIWGYLKYHMQDRKSLHGPSDSPFWGGLVGFVSYEACLQTIDVKLRSTNEDRPDACFVFVHRSIVVDHVAGVVYIQSIRSGDTSWIETTKKYLTRHSPNIDKSQPDNLHGVLDKAKVRMPQREEYCRKVGSCQEAIRSGNSYELCLTDQTELLLPSSPTQNNNARDWNLYQRLRHRNPAPYGCFLRLQCSAETVSVLSSSPERFLGWTRPTAPHGSHCQFRPIKGTVRKTPATTRADAEAILSSSKERAENLMIVDLIRHDLFGVVGAGNVQVTKLMQVEEYETVFQLVSVIDGQLPVDQSKTGIDVLAASLPPGSMTGAPKKRSCEILQEVEEGRSRGVYSGVLGYLDVGGGGDFSVVIRTASRWSGDVETDDAGSTWDVWSIGAGGAVTSQSTDIGEWEEMQTKRDALLDAIGAVA